MYQYERSRHCVGGSNYHMQFTPKYRRHVFKYPGMQALVRAILKLKAHKMGIRLEVAEFGPDHIHIFVTGCRKYSEAQIAQHLKGFSAWYLRKYYRELIKPYCLGASFWSDGYFAESIGRVTTETVMLYIERQQGKHWMHYDQDLQVGAGKPAYTGQSRLDMFGA